MKPYYLSMEDDYKEELRFYAEVLRREDWPYLKEAGELFLIHAYSHLFKTSPGDTEVFADTNYTIRYKQFHLNLAIGLELLLKSILLQKGIQINKKVKDKLTPERTIPFGEIIERHLDKIFPRLRTGTLKEIKDTLTLINLRRNNIAHTSKKSHDSYAHEYRLSYITLYIYEQFFKVDPQVRKLLNTSIERSKVSTGAQFKPLRIKPRSWR